MYKICNADLFDGRIKIEYVSVHIFMRCAIKQCINNNQIHSWTINAVLMTFEEKKSINLILKWGCPILHALTINKQCS